MIIRFALPAVLALSLVAAFGQAPNAVELLQKGIYTQETAGNLDAAIQIYRRVISTARTNERAAAAQAQYRIVACLVRKNDSEGANREFQILTRNFADQPDFIKQARAILPGGPALLPAPWGEREASQLNIKRDGVFTGEYLFYTVDPFSIRGPVAKPVSPQNILLSWELSTKSTSRSLWVEADHETMMPLGERNLKSNDDLGDPAATPFKGPAIDDEVSVFLMRRLPLAVGYTTKIPVTSEALAPTQMELKVTGIEAVQVPSGKYNCYKLTVSPAGQTFWIGIERSRPLVKFQSGSVEAELVKMWGSEDTLEAVLAFFREGGWRVGNQWDLPGGFSEALVGRGDPIAASLRLRKIHTPAPEIPEALRRTLAQYENRDKVRPGSIQERLIGGRQALSCLVDLAGGDARYIVWIRSESTSVTIERNMPRSDVAVFRWRFEPVLEAIKIP